MDGRMAIILREMFYLDSKLIHVSRIWCPNLCKVKVVAK